MSLIYDSFRKDRSPNRGDIKLRYRLYSDGTVIDQKNSDSIVGFITGEELDEIYKINSMQARQKAIIAYLNLN